MVRRHQSTEVLLSRSKWSLLITKELQQLPHSLKWTNFKNRYFKETKTKYRNLVINWNLPGFEADTRVTIFFDGKVVCWSVGSDRASSLDQPWPKNVIENLDFFIFSSDGPSCETNPNVKNFGYWSNKLRPNENLVNIPNIIPKNDTSKTLSNDLKNMNQTWYSSVLHRNKLNCYISGQTLAVVVSCKNNLESFIELSKKCYIFSFNLLELDIGLHLNWSLLLVFIQKSLCS